MAGWLSSLYNAASLDSQHMMILNETVNHSCI